MSIDFAYCLEVWEDHMKNTPDYPVLSDSLGTTLRRSECDELSARVYAWLKQKKIGKEQFVLIDLERGVKPVAAVMGVLKNGSAFCLTESSYARERISYMRDNCNAAVDINEAVWPEILKTEPLTGHEPVDDHDACMIVYTSGTTGTPKGVLHEYGQLKLEMISEQRADGSWRENPDTRWGLVAPLNFVASLKIIVHFLYCGGHLHVLDYDTVKNPKKLNAYFFKNRINETFLSPSLLRLKGENYGPFMKYIYTGAEPANNVSVKGAELNNTYTMSESFFTVCEYIIDKPYPVVPIGRPMFDLKIRLLGEDGDEVEEGELGEFCYFDPYCRGDVNNDGENEKHFIDGWFHTGDLARFRDGNYILEGRSDDMIKIDGNRIEPGEIEAVCREEMGVSVCAAKGFPEGFVALYYIGDVAFDEEELRERLKNRLPYYMIPTYFVRLDSMPLNQSGKLQRSALKMPKEVSRAEYLAPRDEFEKLLCNGFSEVLGIENIGIKDDFFKLGGSSIRAIELLELLDADDISPSMIYEGRTVERIAELYRAAGSKKLSWEEEEELGRKTALPITEVQSLFWNENYDCSLDFFFGLKILPFVSADRLAEKLNRYIDSNSTFCLRIEQDADGKPVQIFCPDRPYIKTERMSFREAKAACDTFIKGFTYGEPLIRIRLIRTPFASFFLFHASHMVMDGAACHFAIEDLAAAVFGKEIPRTDYFAFAWEETERNRRQNFEENLEYFKARYFKTSRTANLIGDSDTSDSLRKRTAPFGLKLQDVRAHCEKQNISVNVFINTAVLLTQCAYNHTSDGMVFWNYHNRSRKSGRGGVMYRSALNDLDMSRVRSLADAYESIQRQNEETLWRYADHDYYRAFSRLIRGPKMTISYMEGWFTDDIPKFPLVFLCCRYSIKNHLRSTGKTSANTLLTVSHYHGKLTLSLQYCTAFLKTENAVRFTHMLESAMRDMLQNRLPVPADR